MSGLFEPGDGVRLKVERAYRVLPDDIFWGVQHDGGFALRGEGLPLPSGALLQPDGLVRIGGEDFSPDRLVLIQDVRHRP